MNNIQEISSLLGKITLKKKGFILVSLRFIEEHEVALLSNIDIEVIRKVKQLLNDETYKNIEQLFSVANLEKQKRVKKHPAVKRRRFGNHAGYREDIKENVKSKTEANVARYLSKKYGRSSWSYETTTFDLDLQTKTGRVKTYTPDFKIIDGNDYFYLEIKPGFLPQSRDKAKLKSFKKKYPDIKLIIVTYQRSKKVIEWSQKNGFEIWIIDELNEFCLKNNIELE